MPKLPYQCLFCEGALKRCGRSHASHAEGGGRNDCYEKECLMMVEEDSAVNTYENRIEVKEFIHRWNGKWIQAKFHGNGRLTKRDGSAFARTLSFFPHDYGDVIFDYDEDDVMTAALTVKVVCDSCGTKAGLESIDVDEEREERNVWSADEASSKIIQSNNDLQDTLNIIYSARSKLELIEYKCPDSFKQLIEEWKKKLEDVNNEAINSAKKSHLQHVQDSIEKWEEVTLAPEGSEMKKAKLEFQSLVNQSHI
jgi:CRISPR/Cas system-associated endoribonuclease Cas2